MPALRKCFEKSEGILDNKYTDCAFVRMMCRIELSGESSTVKSFRDFKSILCNPLW